MMNGSQSKSKFAWALGCSLLGGCASFAAVTGGIGDAVDVVSEMTEGDHVEIVRPVPADNDLSDVSTIALAPIGGKPEEAERLAAHLRSEATDSGRFEILSTAELAEAAEQAGCGGSDHACLAAARPRLALLQAQVLVADYDEESSSSTVPCPKSEKGKVQSGECSSTLRKGKAQVRYSFKLVAPGDGQTLAADTVACSKEAKTSAMDGEAAQIDSDQLLAEARREASGKFLRTFTPSHATERLPLESDGAIPELELGNELLLRGAVRSALRAYEAGIKNAANNPDVDADERAVAHYDLAIAHLVNNAYADAVDALTQAKTLHPREEWHLLLLQVQGWADDAERYEQQLARGDELRQQAAADSSASEQASLAGR